MNGFSRQKMLTTGESSVLRRARERKCRRLALLLSALTGTAALAVLLGWTIDSEALKHLGLGTVIMIPPTAITFLIASAAVSLQTLDPTNERWPWYGRGLSWLVLGIGVTMLAQRAGGFELPINLWLFPDELQRYPYRPLGLMAANSAICFTLLGAGLVARSVRARRSQPSTGLALCVIAVATVALVGYAYGARALYSIDRYAAMAVSTAMCFLTIGVAFIAAEPLTGVGAVLISDDAGAVFTRKLLPITLTVPFIIGFAWLLGRRNELFGRETGIALVVVAIAGIYTAFLFHSARSVSTLDREVREALKRAELARARAEEANRGKAEFLTMMSHELRTPLNAIRGYTQLIELGVRGPVTEEQRVDLARIRHSEEHLLGIIGDILDFASVERGQYRFEIARVALPALLDEATGAVITLATNKGVRIVPEGWRVPADAVEVDRDGLEVLADAQKLRQALINLLLHAVKFTDPPNQVTIAVQQSQDHVVVSVTDAGRGIPADRLATIFDAFTQLEPTLTRTTEGIGLGLAISRQLLRGMGSDIEVENKPGLGSRFFMRLPRAVKPPAISGTADIARKPAVNRM